MGARRNRPTSLQVHLLGGFAVRVDGKSLQGFESQKVRALLAYLACHRERPLGRTFVASLLWGDRPDRSARRNLRQALHNLRNVISACTDPAGVLVSTSDQVHLHPQLDCFVDADAFEEAHRLGVRPGGPDLYHLRAAARIYIGEFLPGFFLNNCPEFETWLITMQERLREAAIQTFSALSESYLGRGELHLGIQVARRLLAIEPMSEGAYRSLMRLYFLSGRPGKALEAYERLRRLLQEELGVEPLEETVVLYNSILESNVTPPERPVSIRASAMPVIPLTGRSEAHRLLHAAWEKVVEKQGRLTLVTGESGIGKTRLARTFVDGATSRRFSLVLHGAGQSSGSVVGLRPFSEMVVSGFSELLPDTQDDVVSKLSPRARADLLRIAPELPEAVPAFGTRQPRRAAPAFADSLIELFGLLIQALEMKLETTPVVLLLDDLHWCDRASLALVADLLYRAEGLSLWVLATTTSEAGLERALLRAAEGGVGRPPAVDRVPLERLLPLEVQEIATALTGIQEQGEWGQALYAWTHGLPLAVAEAINWLRDLGILEPTEGGFWFLTRPVAEIEPPPGDLHDLIRRRIELLPASARRAISTAAVIGDVFEAEFLRQATDEDDTITAICLQRLLERWLIRHSPGGWSRAGRESDVDIWERGKRQGAFEFAHDSIRSAVLGAINPIRLRTLYGIVGDVLSGWRATQPSSAPEPLAHYYVTAGEWAKALPHLAYAAERAAAAGLAEIAAGYCEQALGAARRAADEVKGGAALAAVETHRAAVTKLLEACRPPTAQSAD